MITIRSTCRLQYVAMTGWCQKDRCSRAVPLSCDPLFQVTTKTQLQSLQSLPDQTTITPRQSRRDQSRTDFMKSQPSHVHSV